MITVALFAALVCGVAHPATIEVGSGLGIVFDTEKGTIGENGGFSVADLDAPDKWTPMGGTLTGDSKRVEFSGQVPDLGLAVEATFAAREDDTVDIVVTLGDTTGKDRGASVRLARPVKAEGLVWWDSLDRSRKVEAGKDYRAIRAMRAFPSLPYEEEKAIPGTGEFSPWFFGCVTRGAMGLAIGRRPDSPSISRFAYDAATGALTAECDAGLSPAQAKSPQKARFHLVAFRFDGRLGMRGALARYYELFPEAFENRAEKQGMWLPFGAMRRMQDCDEFGIQFHESGRGHAFDKSIGVNGLVYMFPSAFHATTAKPVPEDASADELIRLAEPHHGSYGGKGKQRIATCIIEDAAGKHPIAQYAERGIRGQANVDPDLPLSGYYDAVIKRYMEGATTGVYYDGLPGGINYRREHLSVADYPAIYDAGSKRVGLLNLFTAIEWTEKVAGDVHGRGGLTMVNNSAMDDYSLYASTMDILGAETSLRIPADTMAYCRACCYQKPFCTLLKGDFNRYTTADLELYTKRLLTFGHFAGMFDVCPSGAVPNSNYWLHPEWYNRDRLMFRKYGPLARDLAAAGWEPVTRATANEPVIMQRFGHLDDGQLYFTVLNEGAIDRELTVSLEAKKLGFGAKPLEYWEDVRNQRLSAKREGDTVGVKVNVPAGDIAMIRIAEPEVMAAVRLERVAEMVKSRQTYAEQIAKFEELAWWKPAEGGYKLDYEGALHGAACIRCECDEKPTGASQTASLYQHKPGPVTITAHARLDDVASEERDKCVVNLVITSKDAPEVKHTMPFTGAGEWLEASHTTDLHYPIATIDVSLASTCTGGRVWFDDVSVVQAGSDVNALHEPSFENGVLPPDVEEAVGLCLETITRAARDAAGGVGKPASALAEIAEARKSLAELEELLEPADLGPAAGRLRRDARDIEACLDMATSHLTGAGPLHLEVATALVPGSTSPVKLSVKGRRFDDVEFGLHAEGCKADASGIAVPASLAVGTSVVVRARARGTWHGQPVQLHRQAQHEVVRPFAAAMRISAVSADNLSYALTVETANRTDKAFEVSLQPQPLVGARSDVPATVTIPAGESVTTPVKLVFSADAPLGKVSFDLEMSRAGSPPTMLSRTFTFVGNQPNRIISPGFEQANEGRVAGWAPYGKGGYEIDTGIKHSGEASIRCRVTGGEMSGALQGVGLKQKVRCPVFMRGFSRCEDVKGGRYCLYADCYYQEKGALHGQQSRFSPGTHDWEYTEKLIEPRQPIKSIAFYCMFRYRPGTVWFDDIFLCEDPTRKDNLLATDQAHVTTDSNYGTAYNPGPLTDGLGSPQDLHWAEMAWASKDKPGEHWIEMSFDAPTEVSRVHIFWHQEDRTLCTSRAYDIEAHDGKGWQRVVEVREPKVSRLSVHRFEPVTTKRLRIRQLDSGGPSFRPNIMWVAEVEAFKR